MHELPATFGKYYLTEKLATGGMAEIYLAKILGPAGFEKQLVIKQIHPRLSDQRHFVDLFVAEAKILVGLAHGNIVPVYELGVVDETYFIAMEYIDGPTLYRLTEAVWRAGALIAPPLAAWIAGEILDGLDYAHRKGEGVIHRDLSPRNVMLSRDGEVKLVDFGIAVGLDYGGEEEGDGAPTGSFPYMSPEQVRRQRLTGQSDLFSVSVLLWEMLTGRRLFARANPDATLEAVLTAEIQAPSRVRPEVSPRLDEMVLRGLSREPDSRWTTAADYLAALNRYLYTLEPVPGARDLAALIAKHCPPVRATTEAEGLRTTPHEDGDPVDGPATLVHSREGEHEHEHDDDGSMTTPAPEPRGKRPGTVREQSFATHVELERALLRATPLFSFPAIAAIRDDDEAPPASTERARTAVGETQAPAPRSAAPSPDATPSIAREPRPGSPRWGAWLVVLALALAIATGVWLFGRSRAQSSAPPDAAASIAVTPSDASPPDASPPDASEPDAPPTAAPPDARGALPAPRDAGTSARPDAGAVAPPPRGTALLKVGASPWGEVYVDGAKLGNAPHEWTIAAGKHHVVVRFPATDPPQEKSWDIDLAPDASQKLQADFTP